jgi:type I restriction-modification system DNA methylase subunit
LSQNQSGSDNTAVGAYAGVSTSALSNTVAVGASTVATASNQVRLGNASITSLYCYGAYAATTASLPNLYVDANGQIMRSTAKSTTAQLENHDVVIKQLEQRLGEKDREIEKLKSEIEAIKAILEGMVSK